MKISTTAQQLAHFVRSVSRVPDRKATDIHGHILIEATEWSLTLSAHNGQKQISIDVPTDCFEPTGLPCSVCVPAQKFEQVITALPKGANVTINLSEAKVTITSGRSRFTLSTRPAVDFPVMDFSEGAPAEQITMSGDDLVAAMRQVGFCAARQDTRVFLNGVFYEFTDGTLTLAASDGLRLGVAEVASIEGTLSNFILPSTSIEDVCLFSAGHEVVITASRSVARFTTAAGTLHTKLIDASFPDYRRLLAAASNGRMARLQRADFAGAIDRVALLSEGSVARVRLSLAEGALAIESVSGTTDEAANDVIPCEYDAAPMVVGFNGRLAGEIARSLSGEEIDVYFGSGASGTLLRSRDLSSHSFVLMPVRI